METKQVTRHAPAPNSRLIPSTSAITSGASDQPAFTRTFGLDPPGSYNCERDTSSEGETEVNRKSVLLVAGFGLHLCREMPEGEHS